MKWSIDDVPVFVAVVDQKGITPAAQALGMPKSSVSTALARLERALGLRLVDRNSRNMKVTEEGETFYRQAQLILEQVQVAEAAMSGHNATPSGRLAVALPPAFCLEVVAPNLAGFHARYPEVELELVITSHGVDLLRDRVDLAVAVGALPDSDYIARTLISSPLVLVTSPAYLAQHEVGTTLEEIRSHIQICETRYRFAKMQVQVDGRASQIDLDRGITHANNPLVVRRAVLEGAGVALLPLHYCRDEIASGGLVEVCRHVGFDQTASKLAVVYPGHRLISPRIRAFVDFLDEICELFVARSGAAVATRRSGPDPFEGRR